MSCKFSVQLVDCLSHLVGSVEFDRLELLDRCHVSFLYS